MPHEIHDRHAVQELIAKRAQVVEVLPREDYEEDHLPGAIHLPLRKIEAEARQRFEQIAEVCARVRAAGWDACVVVNEERVVFGLLREAELDAGQEGPVEKAMRPGPSTFRPHVPIEEMAQFMQQHDLASSPITSSDGRLIGILRREDAQRVAHEQHQHQAEPTAEEPTR